MPTVADILSKHQGRRLASLPPTATVRDALQLMADLNVGSVLIMQGEALLGIFTERDYARKLALKGLASASTPLANVMTAKLYVVSPRQTVKECMGIMNQAKIRHLPVVSDGAVVGLVSIGDAVYATMAQQEFLISQLGSYISGDMG
ncbi:CBS domain-containing protein [Ottowia sp.]|uniref:CBS domain-containing protein n=1 Tax=Ottowia sp. TaxID=1898956 RepID=UPI002B586205|nr:CBS domain-containing protein [Ottowia sp.]HOB67421.1 CBS domain-containing protein [Ottowia sp.]HPZ58737.1 CBS domain-containing protein [Ottowia sp.]HQD46971.1 CBS domain-containing protein [Ottowia sp.]